MSVTFSGLASGLDTGSLIDTLVDVERSRANVLSTRQSDLNAQKSIVGSLSTALSALGTAMRGLDLDSEIRPRTGTVSDSRLTVAASAAAPAGAHDVRVRQIAAAKVVSSRTFASQGPGIVGDGGVDITLAGMTKSVSWTSTDTLDGIAAKINDANAGVSAAVLYDGASYRLLVTAAETGTAAAPSFVDTGALADQLDFAATGNVRIAAADAIVSVDGVDVTRPKNVIADALSGVTLTLASVHATADPSARLSVALDQKALTDKIKAVVTAYNAVNSALHVQLDYTGTPKGTNTLFGDATLRQLQGALARVASDSYGGASLGAIGISRDKTGAMTLDESKLASAIAANGNAVADLFVTNGFATALASLTEQYTQSGTGIFASKTQALTERHKALQIQIDRIHRNADQLQTRLEAQFGALEEAMSRMQSQSTYLAGILG